MWNEMTESERQTLIKLARTLWQVDNQDSLPEDKGAAAEMWQENRQDALQKARKVLRKLENQGVLLVAHGAQQG